MQIILSNQYTLKLEDNTWLLSNPRGYPVAFINEELYQALMKAGSPTAATNKFKSTATKFCKKYHEAQKIS